MKPAMWILLGTLIGVVAPIVWLAYPFLHFGGPSSAGKLRESARSLVPPTARVTRINDLQCGFDSPTSCVSVYFQTPGRLEQREFAALTLARFKGWGIVKHVPAAGGASDFVKLERGSYVLSFEFWADRWYRPMTPCATGDPSLSYIPACADSLLLNYEP